VDVNTGSNLQKEPTTSFKKFSFLFSLFSLLQIYVCWIDNVAVENGSMAGKWW